MTTSIEAMNVPAVVEGYAGFDGKGGYHGAGGHGGNQRFVVKSTRG